MEVQSCHDCRVKIGEIHIPGCDWEECPFCHRQLISCNCCYEHLKLDSEKEPIFSQGLTDKQIEIWEKILNKKGLIPYGNESR